MKQVLLDVNDLWDITIEQVYDKDTQQFKDIRIKYPEGRGYDPEVISLVDMGIVNAMPEDGEDDDIYIPYRTIRLYGNFKDVYE